MTTVVRFNVEMVHRTGTALYLDRSCHWSTDPDAAWEYTSEDEAITDAIDYGGEVFVFQRLARRSDLEWSHDSEAARLAYHFQHAAE